jgi:tagaturonate epimerase
MNGINRRIVLGSGFSVQASALMEILTLNPERCTLKTLALIFQLMAYCAAVWPQSIRGWNKMELEKYSFGIGDRFGFECAAQLRALQKAGKDGVHIVPVWNKSNREHAIAGTMPEDARTAADKAVRECGWTDSYYLDADHIGLPTVDAFLPSHDFFTIDVADYIGKPMNAEGASSFVAAMAPYKGELSIPGMPMPLQLTDRALTDFARKYLFAMCEAGKVYRHIAERKGPDNFISEVSVDEARSPQSPAELLLILAAIAREGIPIQTIAPKFTGSFLKGVDYIGDPLQFEREFNDDLAVIAFAVSRFNLPHNLKLSIHTGSDKFTLYPLMHRAITRTDVGIHLKTAGTTWLEEAAGFAASGGEGLALAKEIYQESYRRYDELCAPYLAVINIDKHRLPAPERVAAWSSEEFAQALRHDPLCSRYDPHLRQLLHIGFKVAAGMKSKFVPMLDNCRTIIEENVAANLYERHIRPLFLGQ